MKDTYLLYIDILGFGELARDRHREARRFYHLLESQNVHRHDSFRFIVFSDTILIYSVENPLSQQDHAYLVMFSIEFAQNLLYTTIGKGFFFRAVLAYGSFEHSSTKRIERFFGPALVSAYQAEKEIGCTGLFIDSHCQQYNSIFSVAPWNDQLSFVFLNQSLERLAKGHYGRIPIPPYDLWNSDAQWDLCKDVRMLSDIYSLMRTHRDPRVRAKFLATWNFYYQRYPHLLHRLARRNFDLAVISKGFNWSKAKSRIRSGYRGYGTEPPSMSSLHRIVARARASGKLAVRKALRRWKNPKPNHPIGPAGYAFMILDVDGRSQLGRFLLSKRAQAVPMFRVSTHGGGLLVSVGPLTRRQDRVLHEAADAAALQVLTEELGVDGYLESYWD